MLTRAFPDSECKLTVFARIKISRFISLPQPDMSYFQWGALQTRTTGAGAWSEAELEGENYRKGIFLKQWDGQGPLIQARPSCCLVCSPYAVLYAPSHASNNGGNQSLQQDCEDHTQTISSWFSQMHDGKQPNAQHSFSSSSA